MRSVGRVEGFEWIFIDVQEARSLRCADTNGWSDPYCVVTLGPSIAIGTTRSIPRTLHPRWSERFRYSGKIDWEHNAYLRFAVRDWDPIGSDDLGMLELPLVDFANHKWESQWYQFDENELGIRPRGRLQLRIHLVEDPMTAFAPQDEKKRRMRVRGSRMRIPRLQTNAHARDPFELAVDSKP
jgi:Ca2+-dependent lipid-binding protein